MTASSLGSKNAEKFPVDFEKILLYHVRLNTYNKSTPPPTPPRTRGGVGGGVEWEL